MTISQPQDTEFAPFYAGYVGKVPPQGPTALLTDRYELTMVDAALRAGTHERACVFEVFARRLPAGRRYGIAPNAYSSSTSAANTHS